MSNDYFAAQSHPLQLHGGAQAQPSPQRQGAVAPLSQEQAVSLH
jgi:hypothetical protein